MPTYERCQSCLSKGVPFEEAPLCPEGSGCLKCLKIASAQDHVVTITIDKPGTYLMGGELVYIAGPCTVWRRIPGK